MTLLGGWGDTKHCPGEARPGRMPQAEKLKFLCRNKGRSSRALVATFPREHRGHLGSWTTRPPAGLPRGVCCPHLRPRPCAGRGTWGAISGETLAWPTPRPLCPGASVPARPSPQTRRRARGARPSSHGAAATPARRGPNAEPFEGTKEPGHCVTRPPRETAGGRPSRHRATS